ncbi:hypothetical protein [Nocardia sp. NPDC004711]
MEWAVDSWSFKVAYSANPARAAIAPVATVAITVLLFARGAYRVDYMAIAAYSGQIVAIKPVILTSPIELLMGVPQLMWDNFWGTVVPPLLGILLILILPLCRRLASGWHFWAGGIFSAERILVAVLIAGPVLGVLTAARVTGGELLAFHNEPNPGDIAIVNAIPAFFGGAAAGVVSHLNRASPIVTGVVASMLAGLAIMGLITLLVGFDLGFMMVLLGNAVISGLSSSLIIAAGLRIRILLAQRKSKQIQNK